MHSQPQDGSIRNFSIVSKLPRLVGYARKDNDAATTGAISPVLHRADRRSPRSRRRAPRALAGLGDLWRRGLPLARGGDGGRMYLW